LDKKLRAFIGLSLIFVLNDFAFIPLKTYTGWLAADYISRILALSVIFYLVRSGVCARGDFGLRRIAMGRFLGWAAALIVTGILIDQAGFRYLKGIFPSTALFSFPAADNIAVKYIDLTAGLLLVSLSEETVFRGLSATVLCGRSDNPACVVFASSVIFGLIHWSSGLHAVVTTAVWGILPMVSVLRTGSIYPALAAHWATDFVYFFQ
jgi:membrane protease YdiL (CAAX protease family)